MPRIVSIGSAKRRGFSRLKLRSMVVGEKGDRVYIASEEAAIRAVEPELDGVWSPEGGQPVIVELYGRET